jgi:cold-inducible RNA-binding protein
MTKLFVGGIAYSITTQQLEELFAKYGTVSSAQIVTDKYTNQSKGFAFIEMSNDTEAQNAVKELDGYALEGRKIGVSVARPREDNRNNSRRDDYSKGGNSNFSRNNKRY